MITFSKAHPIHFKIKWRQRQIYVKKEVGVQYFNKKYKI